MIKTGPIKTHRHRRRAKSLTWSKPVRHATSGRCVSHGRHRTRLPAVRQTPASIQKLPSIPPRPGGILLRPCFRGPWETHGRSICHSPFDFLSILHRYGGLLTSAIGIWDISCGWGRQTAILCAALCPLSSALRPLSAPKLITKTVCAFQLN